jgi:toxin FitB
MNLVDSSAWLAFFANTKNAGAFSKPIEKLDRLLVPTIVLYEVTKILMREKGEETAIINTAHMRQGMVVHLDAKLAVSAAMIGLENGLPMADSIILAIARAYDAVIWTQDEHFKGHAQVKFYPA